MDRSENPYASPNAPLGLIPTRVPRKTNRGLKQIVKQIGDNELSIILFGDFDQLGLN